MQFRQKAGKFIVQAAAVFLLALPVQTAAAEETEGAGVQQEQTQEQTPGGMDLFLIPMGRDGIQKGSFWIYTEISGEDGEFLQEEDWSVTASVTGTVTEQVLEIQMSQADNHSGYLYSSVDLTPVNESGEVLDKNGDVNISVNDYSAYQITVNVQKQEETILTKTEVLPNIIAEWPELRAEEWTADGEEAEQNPSVMYDWEDVNLFGRIFTVTLEQVPDSLEATKQENGIWEIHAVKDTDAKLKVIVEDLAGNRAESSYYVQIATGSTEIWYILAGFFLVAAVLAAAIVLRKGSRKNTKGLSSEEVSIRSQEEALEQVYQELKQTAERLQEKQSRYRQLRQENMTVQKQEEQENRFSEADYREQTENYENMGEKLRSFRTDARKYEREWNQEETRKFFTQTIRTIADKRNELVRQEKQLDEKIQELEWHREKRMAQQVQMKRYLEKSLHLMIRTKEQEYSVNKDKIDHGFLLDDCRPLITGKNYEVSEWTFGEIFGVSSGIRFSTDEQHRLWMECEFPAIFRVRDSSGGEDPAVEKELCESGTRMVFLWKPEEKDEISITVETEA